MNQIVYKRPVIYTYESDISVFTIPVTKGFIEHVNNLYKLLGVDMTLEKWESMSIDEQKKFERDLKIRKLLDI